ncbi:TlpA family protein disulfide reductase [Chryseobacterium taichungense]|uniref:TlpA family protein disulfide reductase n=1 Tax=Chryseobacterium taichungense TaxID=295069 RepID=UPI0028A6BAAB|nr:TlpA disulfide reductase family protein [Chryseobacterium taichungense]
MITGLRFLSSFLLLLSLTLNAQRHFQAHPLLEKKIGQHFPIENYKNKEGKNFSANELQGKVSLINFWSTTCAPCIEELPYLNKLEETLGNNINFIAITHDPKEKVDRFLATHQFNFMHITDSVKELQSYFSVIRNPITFIIDKKGNVQEITGNIDEEKMNVILSILSE